MRNGDAYKIQRLIKIGTSPEEIFKRFSRYSVAEITRFFPVEEIEAKPLETVEEQPTRSRRRRSA